MYNIYIYISIWIVEAEYNEKLKLKIVPLARQFCNSLQLSGGRLLPCGLDDSVSDAPVVHKAELLEIIGAA